MKVAGIKVNISDRVKEAIVKNIEKAIKSSKQLQEAIMVFASAWEKAKGNYGKQAWAIYCLLQDVRFKMSWEAIEELMELRTLDNHLPADDWTILNFFATSIASFATGGWISICLALLSAANLLKEICTLLQLIKELP